MRKLKIALFVALTYLKRHKFPIIAALILGLVILVGTVQAYPKLNKKVVTEGIVGTYTERDLPPVVTRLLSKSLVTTDQSGSPSASLAQNWVMDEKGTVYTLNLKDNSYFTDGTNLRANDVILSFPDAEVFYVNDYSIQFKIADIYTPFPTLLNKPVFKQGTLIGTGPYQVHKISKDQIFVKKLELTSNDPNLPDLNISFFSNETTAKEALKLGEVQSIIGVTDLSDNQNQKTLKTFSKENNSQIVTIFYNTKDSVLSDENFRLALSFAAPAIAGEKEAKTSLPETSWAFNSQVRDYLNNPEQAKNYLDKVQNGKDSVITLTTTESLKNVGNQVINAWKSNGIKAQLKVESGIPQNFQALLIAENIPADPDQYQLWHSTQTETNISKISSPRIDKDLEDGRKLRNWDERKQKYQDFQKVLLDQAPATFLYFPKFNVLYMNKEETDLMNILKIQLP